MAMNTTFYYVPAVVEFRLIVFERRYVLRYIIGHWCGLFTDEPVLDFGVRIVKFENFFHRCSQSRYGNVIVGIFHLIPHAVPSVNRLVRIEKKSGEGQIIVKLEKPQVEVVAFDQSYADKFIRELFDIVFTTNNLSVKIATSLSWYAAQYDH